MRENKIRYFMGKEGCDMKETGCYRGYDHLRGRGAYVR